MVLKKSLPLQCVFHSIRFKVNKGWSTAVLLFLCAHITVWLMIFHIYALAIQSPKV